MKHNQHKQLKLCSEESIRRYFYINVDCGYTSIKIVFLVITLHKNKLHSSFCKSSFYQYEQYFIGYFYCHQNYTVKLLYNSITVIKGTRTNGYIIGQLVKGGHSIKLTKN